MLYFQSKSTKIIKPERGLCNVTQWNGFENKPIQTKSSKQSEYKCYIYGIANVNKDFLLKNETGSVVIVLGGTLEVTLVVSPSVLVLS